MSLTGIIRNAFIPRQHKLERHFTEPEALQHDVLQHLLHTAAGTEYGRNHLFGNTRSYDDFVRNVPVNTYEELKGDIESEKRKVSEAKSRIDELTRMLDELACEAYSSENAASLANDGKVAAEEHGKELSQMLDELACRLYAESI